MKSSYKDISNGPFIRWLDKKKVYFGFVMMFVLPFLLWMYIFKDFLNGSITITLDTFSIFSMFKYFYNNLFNGVVPLWDPFVVLGVPNVFIATSGVLSPFMAIFAALHFLGINYYASFILFILFYFILGLTGFYFLALEILEDRFYAWLAFSALLFSGMGPMLFNQLFIYYIFCPTVWLFYFLFRFSKGFEIKYFLGIIVSFMGIFCFYIPLYFLTVFLFFIVFLVCLYPLRLIDFGRGLKCFIGQNKRVFIGGILLIILALTPLIFYEINHDNGNLLFLSRHAAPGKGAILNENALDKYSASAMTFDEVSFAGTLGERMKGGRLFSHLDKYDYFSDDFFYIPVLIYIIIIISAFVSFGRRQLLILCIGLSIFLLSLGQIAPLHRILYNTVFYFKDFRNFFQFMAYLIPIIILFAMFQLKALLDPSYGNKKCWQNIIVNTFLHLCFICFLYWHANILVTTYVTVVISCVLIDLLFLKPAFFKILFFLILLLEPMQVFASFDANSSNFRFSVPTGHFNSLFSYERPFKAQVKPFSLFTDQEKYRNFWYDLAMRDSKGYIPDRPVYVSKFSYILSKMIDEKVFLNYVHNKFYIYDRVQSLKKSSIAQIKEVFSKNRNSAFVADTLDNGMSLDKLGPSATPMIIPHDTQQFKIIDFNANRVQLFTDFNTAKFLVYTDSFDKYWKVFINKHEQKLYRANIAFKGVWLPAGKNEVVFQYSIKGQIELYLFILFLNTFSLIYFLRILCSK